MLTSGGVGERRGRDGGVGTDPYGKNHGSVLVSLWGTCVISPTDVPPSYLNEALGWSLTLLWSLHLCLIFDMSTFSDLKKINGILTLASERSLEGKKPK